jgi:hypothetical protein
MIIANFGINNYKSPIISSSSKDFDRKPLKKHHVGSASASEDSCSMLLAAERLLTGVKIADSECYFHINSQSAINTRNEKLRSESFPQHDVLEYLESKSPKLLPPYYESHPRRDCLSFTPPISQRGCYICQPTFYAKDRHVIIYICKAHFRHQMFLREESFGMAYYLLSTSFKLREIL